MYATIESLKNMLPLSILIRLSDDESSGIIGNMQEERLQEGIDTADAEINSYISGRVDLPLSAPFPAMLVKLSEDIAIYNIYSRLKEELPATRQVRYENAIRWLLAFIKGDVFFQELIATEGSGRAVMQLDTKSKIFTTSVLDTF